MSKKKLKNDNTLSNSQNNQEVYHKNLSQALKMTVANDFHIKFLDETTDGSALSETDAKILKKFLTNNKTIYWLTLSSNPSNHKVLKVIAEGIIHNTSIKELDLRGMDLSNHNDTLYKIIKNNKSIHTLKVDSLSPSQLESLRPAFEKNHTLIRFTNGYKNYEKDLSGIFSCEYLNAHLNLYIDSIDNPLKNIYDVVQRNIHEHVAAENQFNDPLNIVGNFDCND